MKKAIIIVTAFLFFILKNNAQNNKNKYKILKDSISKNVKKMMQRDNLKGLSITVFENYKIIYNQNFGIKDAISNEKINKETAFNTASISKAIVATLCALLEEKGEINLKDPISNYLKRWKLPKSKFTKNVSVTWEHLLSHTSGLSQHGFADFYEGDTIPSITQSLKGELLPRYDKAIDFLFTPGTNWSYSGGGYTVIQVALEDHFKKTLSKLVEEYLIVPLQLKNTTMLKPIEKGFPNNVAMVHDKHGAVIKTGLPICPQIAASGLWSTSNDLAKITIELQNALRDKKNTIISKTVAERLMNIISLKKSGGYGLGWMRSFGFSNIDWFKHDGSNTGVGGNIMGTMKNGNGFVFLANGEKPNRFPVFSYLNNNIIQLMNWEKKIENRKIIPEELKDKIKGKYKDFLYGQNFNNTIIEEENKIYLKSLIFKHFLNKDKSEMVYLGDNVFKIIDYPNYIKFNFENSKLKGITIFREFSDSVEKVFIPLDKLRKM